MSPESRGVGPEPSKSSANSLVVNEISRAAEYGCPVAAHEGILRFETIIEQQCAIAKDYARQGEDRLARDCLNAALALADNADTDSTIPAEDDINFRPVTPYASIARVASQIGQEPGVVRNALDRGVSAVNKNGQGRSAASLQIVQLEILAEAAHETLRDPDYVRTLVDRIHDLDRGIAATTPEYLVGKEATMEGRLRRFDSRVDMAVRYRLGDDYIRSAIDEEKSQWLVSAAVPADELNMKVAEMIRIAAIARKAGDLDYAHSIIEEGHGIARLGADASAFAELARAVYVNEKPGTSIYEAELLQEGFKRIVHADGQEDPRHTAAAVNLLLNAMYGPRTKMKDFLQAQFATFGIRRIKRAKDVASDSMYDNPDRVRHGLLNTLLRGVHLPDIVMEDNGIERRPLSYTFKPEAADKPGVLPR